MRKIGGGRVEIQYNNEDTTQCMHIDGSLVYNKNRLPVNSSIPQAYNANSAPQHSHAVNSQPRPDYGNALHAPVESHHRQQAPNSMGTARTPTQNILPNFSRGERYYTIATLDLLPGEKDWPAMSRIANARGVRNCNRFNENGSPQTWVRLHSGETYWTEFIECSCTKGKNGMNGARLRMRRTEKGQIEIQYDTKYRNRCLHSNNILVFYE